MKARALAVVLLIFAGATLAWAQAPPLSEAAQEAEEVITPALLRAHDAFLSDDLLEGRGPGTRGGELAAKYIAAEFQRMGLKPGAGNGTYFQPVTLVGQKLDAPANLMVTNKNERHIFKYYDEFVPFTDLGQRTVSVKGELVFAGYGIVAPEYKWDDFKGMDLSGKILVELVNDPPATPAEPNLFGGRALTYYGRWTYKYEEAARQGAAGVILIHTTDSAGYPFSVVQSSWSREQFSLPRQPGDEPPLSLKAWVSREAAEKILSLAGQNLAALQQVAAKRDFHPIPLNLTASTEMQQTLRHIQSANVIGVLPGRDAKLSQEYVIYTAHYDHLGVGEPVNGDSIYNGANDNGLGVSALLGIAEAMTRLEGGSARSQVFMSVTAEESGLLGSLYYARNPVFPLAQTVADVNIDGLSRWGRTRDIVEVGSGKSELDEVAQAVAGEQDLKLLPDQSPEKGFFYRSDQFSLAKVGIPGLYFDEGRDIIGKPADFGEKKFEEYVAHDYHQPSDEIKPDWDWSGAQQMAQYLFGVGWTVANWGREFHWAPTAEFRAARQESLRKAGRLPE